MTGPPPLNVAAHVPALARSRPHAPAVVCPVGRRRGRVAYVHLTFRQLDEASDRLAHALTAAGVRRGARTALMVTPGPEFFALTFALFKLGAVLVLIDPGMGVRNLGRCLAEAQPEAFVGIPKAHVARRLLGWARRSLSVLVTTGRPTPGGGELALDRLTESVKPGQPFPMAEPAADEVAAVLFTSGSTGPAKGAVYTHGAFAAQVEMLRRLYDIRPDEIDLCTFPLFALFGPALGMTAVVPDMDATRPARADPRKLIEAVEDFGVTNLFGSPALLNRLGRFGAEQGVKLPTLKRVISAGAPVPASVIERMTQMLAPGVQVFTPYGATEALPVASVGSDEILRETRLATEKGAGVCVGRPVEGVRVDVIRISDEPIPAWDDSLTVPAGTVGEVVVRGPQVTRRYYNRPQADALAKITDPASGEVAHRMGDLGYLDDCGRLWFCGRKAHRVVTPNETLFTIPCEAVFNTHPQVFRTALVGVSRGGVTEPVLCVELEPAAAGADREKLRRELLAIGAAHPHTRSIRTVLFHPAFPVDIRHNAKIFREKLAAWAAGRLR
jgi:acyl-CoA synthetase (AMP-forming)/AMP-acid ligase II